MRLEHFRHKGENGTLSRLPVFDIFHYCIFHWGCVDWRGFAIMERVIAAEIDFGQPSPPFVQLFDSRLRMGHVSKLEIGTNYLHFFPQRLFGFTRPESQTNLYRYR